MQFKSPRWSVKQSLYYLIIVINISAYSNRYVLKLLDRFLLLGLYFDKYGTFKMKISRVSN